MKRSAIQIKTADADSTRQVTLGRRRFRWLDRADVLLTFCVATLVLGTSITSLTRWWSGSHTGAARILESHGKVIVRNRDAMSWYDVSRGEYLQGNELIKTQRASTLRLRWANGTELELQPDSQIQISRDKIAFNDGVFHLRSGWEKVFTTFGNNRLELNPGTEVFFVAETSANREQIVVARGEVTLKGKQLRKIGEGETLKIKPEEFLLRADPNLTFDALEPKNNETVLSPTNQKTLNLKWNGQGESIELDQSPGFLNPRTYAFSSEGVNVILPWGRYFWRLVDKHLVSPPSTFVVLPTIAYRPLFPTPETYVVSQGEVTLQWEAIPEASVGSPGTELEFAL